MWTRVYYCRIDNEAVDVGPDKCRMPGYLDENSREAVFRMFAGAVKIFVWAEELWYPLESAPPDVSLEDAKFLVVTPLSTSGDFILRTQPVPLWSLADLCAAGLPGICLSVICVDPVKQICNLRTLAHMTLLPLHCKVDNLKITLGCCW